MKCQRRGAPTTDNEVVMPDGEIVYDANYVGGTRYAGCCPGLSRAGAIGRPLPQGRHTGGPTDVFGFGIAATRNAAHNGCRREDLECAAHSSSGRAMPPRLPKPFLGLVASGVSMVMMLHSDLGLVPGDGLHQAHSLPGGR